MLPIDANIPVGQLLAQNPHWSSIFDKYRIDYCCGGKISLSEACLSKKLDLTTLIQELLGSKTIETSNIKADLVSISIKEVIEHIVKTYHKPLQEDLPYLLKLSNKVVQVHQVNHPELVKLDVIVKRFCIDLQTHMQKEEQVLFPMCIQLESAKSLPSFHCGSVKNPIAMMMSEHDSAGQDLALIRELTLNFTLPDDACNSYCLLYNKLEQIEQDLRHHVHIENNILFPRVTILEIKLAELLLISNSNK